jgi:hypothetical protein
VLVLVTGAIVRMRGPRAPGRLSRAACFCVTFWTEL